MNLTTLANVRQWLGSSTDTDNALLTRLIAEASRMILNYLSRADIGLTTITETISGQGTPKVFLRNWPVIAVNTLSINGVNIPASTGPTSYGYFLEQLYGSTAGRAQSVGIVGSVAGYGGGYPNAWGGDYQASPPSFTGGALRAFSNGVGNIQVNYSYGYAVQNEPVTIGGSPYEATPASLYGSWIGDGGVSYASGGALTAIASGTPATGQYVPPGLTGDSPQSFYQFAAGDTGAKVLLNYNYVPYDLEQACIEVVAERYRYKERIGMASKTLGGQETASYMVRDALTAAIKGRIDPYKLSWQ